MKNLCCGIHATDKVIPDDCPHCTQIRLRQRDEEIERLGAAVHELESRVSELEGQRIALLAEVAFRERALRGYDERYETLKAERDELHAIFDSCFHRDEQTVMRDNVRLRAEVQKTRDAGAVWDRAYQELRQEHEQLKAELAAAGDGDTWREACQRVERELEVRTKERDEAREDVRGHYRWLELRCGRYVLTQFRHERPWLEETE
jgi:chromosome segregation ATPase